MHQRCMSREWQTWDANREDYKGLKRKWSTGTNAAPQVQQHSLPNWQHWDLVQGWLLGVWNQRTSKRQPADWQQFLFYQSQQCAL